MIKSMTGYGSAKRVVDDLEITVEVKSVNNRYLDTNIRLPRNFLFAEDSVKSAVQEKISRGKVDVFVNIDHTPSADITVKVNEPVLKGYMDAIRHISEEYGIPADVSALSVSKLPDVLTVEKEELDADKISAAIREITLEALGDFNRMREKEGEKLRDDVLSKLVTIEGLVAIVEQQSPKTLADYTARLESKMAEILGEQGIDQNRILAEAAIFADKIAVDEETVRIHSHISQLRSMVNGESPIGRKIDFLVQELNREANTTGSKCLDAVIAHTVVDMKSEIEKIREQIQNIE